MESPNPQLEVSENMEEAEGVPLNEYTTLKFNEENLRINLGLSRKGNSSHVWDYFGFLYNSHENAVLDSENVYCNLCFAAKELKR